MAQMVADALQWPVEECRVHNLSAGTTNECVWFFCSFVPTRACASFLCTYMHTPLLVLCAILEKYH